MPVQLAGGRGIGSAPHGCRIGYLTRGMRASRSMPFKAILTSVACSRGPQKIRALAHQPGKTSTETRSEE